MAHKGNKENNSHNTKHNAMFIEKGLPINELLIVLWKWFPETFLPGITMSRLQLPFSVGNSYLHWLNQQLSLPTSEG